MVRNAVTAIARNQRIGVAAALPTSPGLPFGVGNGTVARIELETWMADVTDQSPSSFADFEALLGHTFEVGSAGAHLSLTLRDAKKLNHGTREGGAFSLVFVAETEIPLPQGCYELTSEETRFDIFLVPIGPFETGMGYEAVFT